MATQVCLTIDTEFSIGGAFKEPNARVPLGRRMVTGAAGGREEGLGFILATLHRHGLKATFFVEALNRFYFGDEEMGALAARIAGEGHDVQLHLHPAWLRFRHPAWREQVLRDAPHDSCAGRSEAELDELISLGLEAFVRWRLARPVALRTGNLMVDRNVYRAMRRHSLPLASNIGVAINEPSDSALRLRGGRHWIEGVLEVPVLTYTAPGAGVRLRRRALTVTGTGWSEMREIFSRAMGISGGPIVLLTHPFEFFKPRRSDYSDLRRNRVNQIRFERLCRFIGEHREKLSVVTFAGAASEWLAGGASAEPRLAVSARSALARIAENQLNDRLLAF